jgi:hypothetical protein
MKNRKTRNSLFCFVQVFSVIKIVDKNLEIYVQIRPATEFNLMSFEKYADIKNNSDM